MGCVRHTSLTHTRPIRETALKRPCRHLCLLVKWLMWRHKLSSMPRWVSFSSLPPSLSWILFHISVCKMIRLVPTPPHPPLPHPYFKLHPSAIQVTVFFPHSPTQLLSDSKVYALALQTAMEYRHFESRGEDAAWDSLRMWCSKWQVLLLCNSPPVPGLSLSPVLYLSSCSGASTLPDPLGVEVGWDQLPRGQFWNFCQPDHLEPKGREAWSVASQPGRRQGNAGARDVDGKKREISDKEEEVTVTRQKGKAEKEEKWWRYKGRDDSP